jgi:hypothetical protein
VLLGFSDAREEAAFQLAKARRLEESDYWSEAFFTMAGLMALPVASYELLRIGDAAALIFLGSIYVYWALVLYPIAVHRAARPVYRARRGWLWSVTLLLAGIATTVTRELLLLAVVFDSMSALIFKHASLVGFVEFVVRPALLRLSVPQQAVASIGCALTVQVISCGPADGPYSLAACLAMGAAGVVWAGMVDARARRTWRVLVQQASVAAAVAGPGPGAVGGTKSTTSLSRAG